jgi:hypothetical protein
MSDDENEPAVVNEDDDDIENLIVLLEDHLAFVEVCLVASDCVLRATSGRCPSRARMALQIS